MALFEAGVGGLRDLVIGMNFAFGSDVSEYDRLRARERQEVGESFGFGPGYMSCARDYIDRGDASLLLDAVAGSLKVPRNKIVPVMAGSCASGGYLAAPAGAVRVLQVTDRLDVVEFATEQQAKAFRREAPVLFPLSVTQDAISKAANGVLKSDFQRPDKVLKQLAAEKDKLRLVFEYGFNVPPSQVSFHLGADEGIKALFRFLAAEGRSDEVYMSFPNYFDAIDFAKQYGFKLFPLGRDLPSFMLAASCMDPKSRPIVYLSNPNNPLGEGLDPYEVTAFKYLLPPGATLIVDSTNVDLAWSPMGSFRSSFVDAVGGARTFNVSSSSKRYHGVTSRFGFVQGPEGAMEEMRKLESPCFGEDLDFLDNDAWAGSMAQMRMFRTRLQVLAGINCDQIKLSNSRSNFVTVLFRDSVRKDDFMRRMAELDPARANASAIVGLPLTGAGELELNGDGSVKTDTGKPGILGLSEDAVRLNLLNHPVILEVLKEALR